MFQEILSPSFSNVNDSTVSLIFQENIQTWTEAIELVDLSEKKLLNATN